MKLHEIMLRESVSDYLGITLSRLKQGDPTVDIEQLATVLSGLTVLTDQTQRQNISDDEIGMNPNSYQDMYKLLRMVPRDGKNLDHDTDYIFTALRTIAPGTFKKIRDELDIFKNGNRGQKQALLDSLRERVSGFNLFFQKVKRGVVQDEKDRLNPASAEGAGYPASQQ
jgi:hypothetical protein